jgi:cell division protease FtsH
VPLAPDVDPKIIARGTPGFSGADLANLVNEAALMAARRNRRVVSMKELEDAKDKVLMGSERRSMVMTEDEKKLTAYHEAGHALVGLYIEGNDPLHKVTIIPRGRALGVTMNLPERDRLGYKKMEMTAKLAMMYGGRAAEDIIFGPENVTTGASNDIQQATNMARAMVTEYGMSDRLGRLRYNENQDEVFLGHSVARQQNISEKTAQIIDEEIRRICEEAETRCYSVLREHEDALHKVAQALLDYETLSGEEVKKVIKGETIHREEDAGGPPGGAGARSSVPTTNKGKDSGGSRPIGPDPDPEPGPA